MSLRKAIDAKCKDCIYDPLSGLGTWKQQVQGCTSKDCGLWPVHAKSDAGKVVKKYQCCKCGSSVTRNATKVTRGYFAYCSECDEDMYEIEVREVALEQSTG